MRRFVRGAAVGAGVLVMLLAGCAKAGGVDGVLIDEWAVLPQAKQFQPEPGKCREAETTDVVTLTTYKPIECAESHFTETLHVGTFTGEHASRPTAPTVGTPAMRFAFLECDAKVKEYLGADWRDGLLRIEVAVPGGSAWEGGARWFMCEAVELSATGESDTSVRRAASLKGALASTSPLLRSCYTYVKANASAAGVLTTIECTKAHNAEYAGAFVAPEGTFPKDANQRRELFLNGCYGVAAKFAAVPNDSNLKYRTGLVWYSPTEDEWDSGDRGARCYLWFAKNVNRSMKGAGPNVLPAS